MNLTELRRENMTGQDILSHKFSKQLRGFRSNEVDAYLRDIADEMD